jgi:hypothetical protein
VTRPRRVKRDGRAVLAGPPAAPEAHPNATIARLPAGTELRRIYWPEPFRVTATSFRYNGPRNRFDQQRRPEPFPAAGDDPERGIFYAAPSLECCIVECFGDEYVIDTEGARLAVLATNAELRLLDIRKDGAIAAGTLAAVNQDGARDVTQDWGRYWYEHNQFEALHGLLFAGAHNDEDALALWERAGGSFEPVLDLPLADPAVLRELVVIAHRLEMTLTAGARSSD